ncbi:unnamed protein product [Echinostoma caproni]|uniref:Uncharacterized protein n=1 Tax=Echinostoma caproni TaxID=27848 RepID=A0A183B2A7_9TREM|nr:unnamed protein product [Echinostoma caproni]
MEFDKECNGRIHSRATLTTSQRCHKELETTASNVRNSLQLLIQLGFLCQRTEPKNQAENYESATGRNDSNSDTYQVCDRRCTAHGASNASSAGSTRCPNGSSAPDASDSTQQATDPWMFSGQSDGLDDDESVVSSIRQRKEKELQLKLPIRKLGIPDHDRVPAMHPMTEGYLALTSHIMCASEPSRFKF